MSANMRNLPALAKREIPRAVMPLNYQQAALAIAECSRIDEVKDFEDRYVAMAVYARQIKDDSMRDAAVRIQLRARTRLGELLATIPSRVTRPGIKPPGGNPRMQAANEFGISQVRVSENMMIARVPAETRNRLIEQTPPAKLHEFYKHDPNFKARHRHPLEKECPTMAKYAYECLNIIRNFHGALMRQGDPVVLGAELSAEYGYADEVTELIEWLDKFEQHIPKKDSKP